MSTVEKETVGLVVGDVVRIPGNIHDFEVIGISSVRTRLNMVRRESFKLTLKDGENGKVLNFTFTPETRFTVLQDGNESAKSNDAKKARTRSLVSNGSESTN